MGVILFDNRKSHLTLTAAGQVLRDYARQVIGLVDQAEAAAASMDGELVGHVNVICSAAWNHVFPRLFADFQMQYPRLTMTVRFGRDLDLLPYLLENRASLGFLQEDPRSRHLDVVATGEEAVKLVVAARADHPLASWEIVDPSDLDDYPMVTFPGLRDNGQDYLSFLGHNFHIVMEIDTQQGVKAAVEAGLGIAVLADFTALPGPESPSLVQVPINAPLWTHHIYAVCNRRRRLTAVEQALVDYVFARLPRVRFQRSTSALKS